MSTQGKLTGMNSARDRALTGASRRFVYQGWAFQQSPGWLGIGVGLVFVVASILVPRKIEWGGVVFGVIWSSAMASTAMFWFRKQRPLLIDEHGVVALVLGKAWKSVAWSDVVRIERLKRTMIQSMGGTRRSGYEIAIVGPHDAIDLDDRICDFRILRETLNFYSQQYNIPLLARDKDEETQARIKATVVDRKERKRLLKEGLQIAITSL